MIGVSAVLVVRLIGVTMLSYGSVTYAVAPLGVMAMWSAYSSVIGVPARLVARSIGHKRVLPDVT